MNNIESFLEYHNNISWGLWNTINSQDNFDVLYFNTNYVKRLKRLIQDLIIECDFEIINLLEKDFECIFLIKDNKNERTLQLYLKDARQKELINTIIIETTTKTKITNLKNLVLDLKTINEM